MMENQLFKPYISRFIPHFQFKCIAFHDLLMSYITLIVWLSVELHRLDITVLTAGIPGNDRECLSVVQV